MRSPHASSLLLLLLSLCLGRLAAALPVLPQPPHAAVFVHFSSPPHSYAHTHDGLQASAQTTHDQVLHQPQQYPYALQPQGLGPETRTYEVSPLLPRGRSLEVAPLLEETQGVGEVSESAPSGAELESLIARFANNAPRFFHQFPHQRALLANIQLRLSQDLSDLRLGSIRPGSPFLRA